MEVVSDAVSLGKEILSKFSKKITTVEILHFSQVDRICDLLKPGGVAAICMGSKAFSSKGQVVKSGEHMINCKRTLEGKYILYEPNGGDILLADRPEEAADALKMTIIMKRLIRFSVHDQGRHPFANFYKIDCAIAEPLDKQILMHKLKKSRL
ncbi:MAG: hypothetical protein GY874_08680 [Desulfobacteraceae bacterium]|nr:hypothetical protein [Desulfobacteraceae bacterium]